jgi:hypothetical protein
VYILGGTGVISSGIESQLRDMGISTNRLGGADRYETSQLIVKNFDSSLDKFTVVTGKDFHNALVASVYANKINHPLILVDNDSSSAIKSLVDNKDLLIVGDYMPNATVADEPGHTGNQVKQQLYSLGFVDKNGGLVLNKYGVTGATEFNMLEFDVLSGNIDMSLGIFASNPEIDEKIKTILNLILPTQGNTLYSILNDPNLQTKTVQLDGRSINIRVMSYGLSVDFGPVN